MEIRAYLEPDLISSTARYWSRFGDARYAEAFEVIREAADVAGQPAESVPRPGKGQPGLSGRCEPRRRGAGGPEGKPAMSLTGPPEVPCQPLTPCCPMTESGRSGYW